MELEDVQAALALIIGYYLVKLDLASSAFCRCNTCQFIYYSGRPRSND